VQGLCDLATGHTIVLVTIGLVEVAAALSAKERQGALQTMVRDNLLRDLQHDAQNQYWLMEIDQATVARGIGLTTQYKLRGYDATHLACALTLQDILLDNNLAAPVLLSADQDLLAAAQASGLATDDPNLHP
jgi:hypothetical protein